MCLVTMMVENRTTVQGGNMLSVSHRIPLIIDVTKFEKTVWRVSSAVFHPFGLVLVALRVTIICGLA